MAQKAEVRIDVDGLNNGVALTPVKSSVLYVGNASWLQDKKECYLVVSGGKITNDWSEMEFSFIPENDGTVSLILRGPWYKPGTEATNRPVWVAYDNLIVTGAEIKNPDFEEVNPGATGFFSGWGGDPANMVVGKDDSKSGKNYIKVWHNVPVAQDIAVKKGNKVTIKFSIKAILKE
jgi:hypothetical protein